MKNFTTLFVNCPNIGLVKDVGQIPYHLGKKKEINTALVSSCIDFKGAYISDVPDLKLVNIPLKFRSETLTGLLYLLKNATKIDCLNLYHCRRNTYLFACIYKIMNFKGKVYVKLDAGFKTIELIKTDDKYKNLFKKITKKVDYISAESKVAVEYLQKYSVKTIHYIPNGINYNDKNSKFDKENIFLTVARIGAPEKNDELLLEAFERISDKCDWSLHLVGKVEDEFKEYLNLFFEKYPGMKERVVVAGEISNKKELDLYYRKAKVFVLPSKFESFSLACVEALAGGCYLILSNQVTPINDFINKGKFGKSVEVDNLLALADTMEEVAKLPLDDKLFNCISDYARSNFTWENICDRLYDLINKD